MPYKTCEQALPSWEKEFDEKYPTGVKIMIPNEAENWEVSDEIKDFIRQTIKTERELAISDIKDIIIDWEKELGELKTKDGSYVNLTYLLGKI